MILSRSKITLVGQSLNVLLLITGEVGVFDGGDDCETATLSVDWDSGEISFQQPNVNGVVFETSCVASGFEDDDGCDP